MQGFARRAKYIECFLDDGAVLLLHLGMSGRLVFDGAPCGPHEHLTFTFDDGTILRFVDPRRFGMLDLWPAATLAEHKWLANLGLEPLDAGFNGRALGQALARRRTALKVALMDQRLVVGVGNIYASESLFRARLDPARAAGSLGAREAGRLARSVRDRAAGGDRGRRLLAARLCPVQRRAGQFPAQLSCLRPARASPARSVPARSSGSSRVPARPIGALPASAEPSLPGWGWTGRGRVVFNLLRCSSRIVRRSVRSRGQERPIDAL